MKKVFAVLVVVLAAVAFSACGNKAEFDLDAANEALAQLTINRYAVGYFDVVDSMESWKENKEKLVEVAKTIPEGFVLAVTGFTCNIGSDAANMRLGLMRANAIAKYLKNQGVTAVIETASKGEKELRTDKPANSNFQRCVRFKVRPQA